MIRHSTTKVMTIILTLLSSVFAAPAAFAVPPSAPTISVCSLPGVILGTIGDDNLIGTEGDDVICGLGGLDRIDGLGGDDIIIGGTDIDTLIGGSGDDQIVGGIGPDDIVGGSGSDDLWGGDGDDSIDGGSEADYVSGGQGADNLFGSAGTDSLFGEGGDDSLNGGTENDLLDGGSGVDICQKQAGDHTQSCYFDKTGPTLVNIAISPSDIELDSTSPSRLFHFRFTLKDPGTGSKYVSFSFINASNFNYWLLPDSPTSKRKGENGFGVGGNVENTPACNANTNYPYTICKVSGSATLATYEAAATLPRNLLTESYKLVGFSASDLVSNGTNWEANVLKKKNLSVSFKQIGINDRTAPTLSDFRILGDKAISSSTGNILAEIDFAELGGNSLGGIQADFRLTKKTSHSFSVAGTVRPGDLQQTCPEDYSRIIRSCLISGTTESGKAVVRMSINSYGVEGAEKFGRGLGKLVKLTITDGAGNPRSYSKFSKSFVAKNIVYESFGTVSDNDHSAPVLLSLKASTSTINTSSSSQKVIYTMTAKDVGKGVDSQFSWLNVNRNFSDGSGMSIDYCKTVSTKPLSQGRMEFKIQCDFPAHFTSGTFTLNVLLYDTSANSNSTDYDSNQLRELGYPYQLVNSN